LQFKTSITWKYAGLPSQPIAGCTGFLLLTKGLGDAEIRRIIVTGLPRQKKISKTPSQQKKAVHDGAYLSSQLQRKQKIRELWSKLAWAKNEILTSRIIREKRAGSMDQVVECLPHKHGFLNSKSSTTKI
jgi:hypothetical protein